MAHRRASVPVMASEQLLGESETLDSAAVMALLHISRRTLERYVADGELPFSRLPSGHRRYFRADVEALLSPERSAS